MVELEEFLNFLFENLDDPRIEFYKKMKYGFRHYFINLTLKCTDDVNKIGRDTKTLQVIIDCRNNCIEIGQWEELLVYESEELTKKWSDKIEEIYQNQYKDQLINKIKHFFDNVDSSDKDLGRRWKMKDLFNDEENKNPTI